MTKREEQAEAQADADNRQAKKAMLKHLHQQSEAIYKAYPRKAAKPRALRAIEKALISCPEHMLLNAAQEMRKLWEPCDEEKKKMFPHPATFFNQAMWDDLADFRLRFPPPKQFYQGTVGPHPDVLYKYPSDAVDMWIEAGKTPEEAKRLAVRVYR